MSTPGVALANPAQISASLKAHVAAVLAEVPPDKHTALVAVATDRGVNLALAVRRPIGPAEMEIAAWIGKSGWDQPLTGGVSLKAVW